MNLKENLRYAKTHEWVEQLDEHRARVGLTDYAQNAMGDLVYAELPQVGDAVKAGESMAEVESVKAVSGVYAPVTGVVCAVNDALADAPETINADPYGAWLVEIDEITDWGTTLDAGEYQALIEREEA